MTELTLVPAYPERQVDLNEQMAEITAAIRGLRLSVATLRDENRRLTVMAESAANWRLAARFVLENGYHTKEIFESLVLMDRHNKPVVSVEPHMILLYDLVREMELGADHAG